MEQQLILDRYRPLGELGEGGYGVVTLAWDTRMQRRVAIKRLPLPLDADGLPVENPPGLAEARTAALLNHPSIVTVFDFETDADEAFLIMEHVDGASLERILDDLREPLELDETAAVIEAVASALEYAHDNGVLHLDIKPGNVLITRYGRAKVADFGMAALSSATGHGPSAGGTLGYMPLEQLKGEPVSEATDEWALGMLTYECLTGENPFDETTVPSAIARLEFHDPPAPSASGVPLSPVLDDIVLTALGQLPGDRYESVGEFAEALLPNLGDAAAGRTSLSELVADYAETEEAEDLTWDRLGLWDRLQGTAGSALLRGVAALESGWLAWAGLAVLPLENVALLGAVALVTLAGALAPALGTGLGLIAFAIGLFMSRAWILASVFSGVVLLWWWFVGRKSAGASVLALSAPVLGVIRVPLAAPLLAGFSLAPAQAAAAGLVGGALTILGSAASFSGPPYTAIDPRVFIDMTSAQLVGASVQAAFSNPATYFALAGWPVAAFVMSLFCRRASRISALFGALLGTGILFAAYISAREFSTAWGTVDLEWNSATFLVSLAASLTMVAAVTALGAPVRPEDENLSQA